MSKSILVSAIINTITTFNHPLDGGDNMPVEMLKIAEVLKSSKKVTVETEFSRIGAARKFRFGGLVLILDDEDATLYSVVPGTRGVLKWQDWDTDTEWLAKLV